LNAKIEIAKFLQDTVEELSHHKKNSTKDLKDFPQFMKKIRSDQQVANEEIIKYSKLFEDEFTIDNLSSKKLSAMCKYMNISTIGSTSMLRYSLSKKLKQLKDDDHMIEKEGVDLLDREELESALRDRGMKWEGNDSQLRKKLQEWIDLSVKQNIPTSILILSRTFILTENESTGEVLKKTISSLPEVVLDEVSEDQNEENAKEVPRKKFYGTLRRKGKDSIGRIEGREATSQGT